MGNQYKVRQFKCLGCGNLCMMRRAKNKTNYCSRRCYESSERPQRKNGSVVECRFCNKKVYKPKGQLNVNNFCSLMCANKYQGRNKIEYICKICGKKFRWSKSRVNPLYCSWDCRIEDKDHIKKNAINGNLIQQKKKGLNKLELAGRKILQELDIEFNEQVLMFEKFLVDVLLKDKKIIIQWDGEYWHNKPKRKQLDKSQDAYMKKCGYKVLRITDRQIKDNIKEVYAIIKRTIQ